MDGNGFWHWGSDPTYPTPGYGHDDDAWGNWTSSPSTEAGWTDRNSWWNDDWGWSPETNMSEPEQQHAQPQLHQREIQTTEQDDELRDFLLDVQQQLERLRCNQSPKPSQAPDQNEQDVEIEVEVEVAAHHSDPNIVAEEPPPELDEDQIIEVEDAETQTEPFDDLVGFAIGWLLIAPPAASLLAEEDEVLKYLQGQDRVPNDHPKDKDEVEQKTPENISLSKMCQASPEEIAALPASCRNVGKRPQPSKKVAGPSQTLSEPTALSLDMKKQTRKRKRKRQKEMRAAPQEKQDVQKIKTTKSEKRKRRKERKRQRLREETSAQRVLRKAQKLAKRAAKAANKFWNWKR